MALICRASGATVSGLLAVLVAFADGGLTLALFAFGVIIVMQQVEGHLVQPLIMARIIHLPAFVVIVSIVAGATVLGILGAFLAVPAAASLARVGAFLLDRNRQAQQEGAKQEQREQPA